MMLPDGFKFQSPEQKKGYFAFIQWLREQKCVIANDDLIVAFFAQKDHEANQWWLSLVSDHFGQLQEHLVALSRQVISLRKEVVALRSQVSLKTGHALGEIDT